MAVLRLRSISAWYALCALAVVVAYLQIKYVIEPKFFTELPFAARALANVIIALTQMPWWVYSVIMLGLFALLLKALAAHLEIEYHTAYALVGLLPFWLSAAFLYDLSTIVLCTAYLLCLAKQKHTHLVLVLALASLNRETALLLVVVSALYTRSLKLTLVQGATYALMRNVIGVAFAGASGQALEIHWLDHIFLSIQHYERTILSATVFVLAVSRYQRGCRLLDQYLLVTAPSLLLMYFVVGYPFEFRVLLECYPALFLGMNYTSQKVQFAK